MTSQLESHPGFIEEIDASEMELKDPVGKGSFGVVYLALWRGIHVAVKMIDSESERIAFMTELRQLSRVSHRNIIRLYGACRQPVSLVMEFAECGSLYNLLHGPGLQPHYTIAHAMSWCLQCATGVAYLHNMKPKALIHRDLKPPNLLLTNMGIVLKICDFGTACDQHTYMTNNKGSAAWMAPEVFEGCQYSEKCDVFSWGIILWEVLTRRKPFDELGGPAFRIMWAVHSGTRPSLIQNCPQPIEDLMTKCWSATPEVRPSMDEIVQAMTDLLHFFPGGKEPLVFPPPSDNDSSLASSGTSSSYDLTNTDRSEMHMTATNETVRKHVHPPHNPHPNYSAAIKPVTGSSSPVPSASRHSEIFETRSRSRSHTPDPHRTSGLKADPIPPPTPLSESNKQGRRRSSADLIAELEQQPLDHSSRTPIGSRSGSPAPTKVNRRASSSLNASISSSHYQHSPQSSLINYPPKINPPTNNYARKVITNRNSSHEPLSRAYIALELHLQPLPPSALSDKSMEIYEQHCLLAEDYLRVQAEIELCKQKASQLRIELEEQVDVEENRLQNEYKELTKLNKSLNKWKEKMNTDLCSVPDYHQQVWTQNRPMDHNKNAR